MITPAAFVLGILIGAVLCALTFLALARYARRVTPEPKQPEPAPEGPTPVVGAWTLTPTENGMPVLDLATANRRHADVLRKAFEGAMGFRVTLADDAPETKARFG